LLWAVHQAGRSLFAAQEAMTDETAAQLGLNKTDHRCMDIIQRHGRISAGQLAEAANLSTGATTAAIDRMERAGFVRRVPDEHDRRRVLIELSEHALTVGWRVFEPIVRANLEFLDSFSEEELETIHAFLTRCAEHYRDQARLAHDRARTTTAQI
jgi:DNA-binding MarR family transcriptional regulator